MFNVGDILVCQFGYNCTLIDFYKVVRTSKSNVWLVKLKEELVEHDGYGQSGYVKPSVVEITSKPLMRKIKNGYTKDFISINKYSYAYLWDGKPVYFNSMD